MYSWERVARIADAKIVGILRTATAVQAVSTARALLDGGLRVVEVSLVTPDALEAIRELSTVEGDVLIGAGTVLDEASARLAIEADARFLVAPTVNEAVIACGNRYGAPVLAGAQTPTEAVRAVEAGAALVKLFPAETLGPAYLKSVRAALPQIGFVPTGGVGADNIADWFAAGAVAVGVGGSLTQGDTRARVADLYSRIPG
ncbi:bifunctional 4-hydroxy-2-oxoglutarate aldolase/2-dehydro-3-deoxy-phosphogluconate aldolase [Pseudonocardiaceae bacterium YIM PH 21723]|nr:bifunctional 4-hydroxy-2-oxoglutarate aldolase/2-dehydro-3-deoxy-phosphogluconate aldolase [Pseudonocardiaceae bacterium YIM PH 21723]